MNMIQCPNTKCNAENPTNAKFCRKCGTAFTPLNGYRQLITSGLQNLFAFNKNKTRETFTLNTFKHISFQPVSVVRIRFMNRFIIFLCVLSTALFFFIASGIGKSIIYNFDKYFIYYQSYVAFGCISITTLCILFILKWGYRKICFKFNADYIEDNFCGNAIVRIAKKSRMGLFDKKKKKVLLSSEYSDIVHFDNEHLLVSKGMHKGLYSLTYKKIIIPVLYDSISQFSNSVTTVTLQKIEYHYDIKGNELR